MFRRISNSWSLVKASAAVLQAERKTSNIAMLIVEQNVIFALKTAGRFALLERGELGEQGRTDAPDAQETILRNLGV